MNIALGKYIPLINADSTESIDNTAWNGRYFEI
jgi:hypothetical protein